MVSSSSSSDSETRVAEKEQDKEEEESLTMMLSTASEDTSTTTKNNSKKTSNNSNAATAPPSSASSSFSSSCTPWWWKKVTASIHHGILSMVVSLSMVAAKYPKSCIAIIAIISIVVVSVGLVTNFELSLDDETQFAPVDCRPREHRHWYIEGEGSVGYPPATRPLVTVVHRQGQTIMNHQAIERVFDALEVIRSVPGYYDLCGTDPIMSDNNGDDVNT